MKATPLVWLAATVLLTCYTPPTMCRPRGFSLTEPERSQPDHISYLTGENVLRYLQRSPTSRRGAWSLPVLPLTAEEDEEQEGLPEPVKRSEEPPISIDLTFHLLRNMIEMARIESQKEQAELNRKYLEEVGK